MIFKMLLCFKDFSDFTNQWMNIIFGGVQNLRKSLDKTCIEFFRYLLKPDPQLHSKMSAGKLSQMTDAAYENKHMAKSLVSTGK